MNTKCITEQQAVRTYQTKSIKLIWVIIRDAKKQSKLQKIDGQIKKLTVVTTVRTLATGVSEGRFKSSDLSF